ncbi:MAG TPA: DUF6113 family protein [Mycobacteriales bacterium]|nr:DUF6113 family protein [Mycobacteriales bacterium]
MPASTIARVATVVMLAFLSLLLAVTGAFLVPRAPVPGVSVGVVLAVVGNYVVAVRGRRATGSAAAAAVPAVVWLAVVVTLAGGRTEGDVVLTGSWASLAFIVLGALSAAVGIGRREPESPPGTVEAGQDDAAPYAG